MKRRSKIKLIVLGSISLFALLCIGGVGLWSSQGEGLKEGRIGHDTCAYCGMALSEQRHTVSILIKDKNHHDQTLHYDDPGCFFNHFKKENIKYHQGVVYDFDSSRPIPIEQAFFERTQYQTPMGSGWITRERPNDKTRPIKEILKL